MSYDYQASCTKTLEFEGSEVEFVDSSHRPEHGDVVAVKVKELQGDYTELDMEGAETVELSEGDVFIGAFGNRSALKGYVGEVPDKVSVGQELALIGAGGIVGDYISKTNEYGPPVVLEFLGYVEKDGSLLNTEAHGVRPAERIENDVPTLAVVATRMEAGKTTLASNIIGQLDDEGYDVASLKLTGSGNERDRMSMFEAGSEVSHDFVDAGLVTTVTERRDVVSRARALISEVSGVDVDVLVVEFGAGLISPYGGATVMRDMEVRTAIDAVVGVAITVPGAEGLRRELDGMYYDLLSISGPITDTSTGQRKTEEVVGLPSYNAFDEDDVEELTGLVKHQLDI
ncbi:MAG: hypothetical protein ABEK59_00945 [Halobacteria archaeon]